MERMMYTHKLKDIRSCWWCGEPAMMIYDHRLSCHGDSMPEEICQTYSITCSNRRYCGTYTKTLESEHRRRYDGHIIDGVKDPQAEVRALWELGDIKIPLRIILPDNHYVIERTLLPSKYFLKPALTKIEVTRERGIADHLKRNLAIVIGMGPSITDETYRLHKFELVEGHAVHSGVRLKSIKLKAFNSMVFEFESDDTKVNMERNKVDGAWLKVPVVRPPIFDKIYNIMETEPVGDEESDY